MLTQGPLERLVPIENATMDNRSVIEWDKDDIDELKMMKVDVLALGMLTAIRKCFDLVNPLRGTAIDLTIPDNDTATYDMICKADTVGVFQIESRAQMSMLPRLQPRTYYDLRGRGRHRAARPHRGRHGAPPLEESSLAARSDQTPQDDLKAALARTCGVPIFQEQVMQVAMIAAGFTATEADGLRRAMAAWKRPGVLEKYYDKVIKGMRERGYEDHFAEQIFNQIKGFQLRLPREPRRQLRAADLRQRLAQMPRARRLCAPCSTHNRSASTHPASWCRTRAGTTSRCCPST